MGLESFGKEVSLEGDTSAHPAVANRRQLLVARCFRTFQRLLDNGELKPHPLGNLGRGLCEVLPGLELLRQGKFSGKKLVVLL